MRRNKFLLAACGGVMICGMALPRLSLGQTQPLPKPVTPPLPIPHTAPAGDSPGAPPAAVVPAPHAEGRSVLAPFLDDQTLAVAHVDLAALDLKSISDSILQSVDVLRKNDKEIGRARADVAEELGKQFKKIEALRAAGANDLYVVVSLADLMEDRPPFVVVPLRKGTDPKPIEALLNSLAATDRPAGEAAPNQKAPAGDALTASVMGDAVIDAAPGTLDRLKKLQPAQVDVERAFQSAGKGQIVLAVIPQAGARETVEHLAPNLPAALGGGPVEPLTRGLQWLSTGIGLPPNPSLRIVLQGKDADAARSLQTLAEKAIAWAGERKDGPREALAFTQFVSKLKPSLENNQVVLELKDAEAREFASVLAASMLNARSMAAQQQSMSNLKQIDLGIIMYASEHKGSLPKDLGTDLAPYLGPNAKQLWVDPFRPNQQHPYVYIKLAPTMDEVHSPAESIVLYENHTTWDNGINVAFADGHSEFMAKEEQFKRVLEQTKKMNPGSAEMPK